MLKSKRSKALGVCAGFIAIACFSAVAFLKLPSVLKHLAISRSGIIEGSLAADLYSTIPFDVRQKVYVFNVTNVDEFFNGAKPRLQQIGPFVFRVGFRKHLSWSNGGQLLSFRENRKFWYDAAHSNGNLNDTIYTVDPVYVSAQEALDELPNFIKKLVIPLLQSRKVLFERKIGEILYDGYTDTLAELAHMIRPDLPIIGGKIGFLRAFNDTDDGELTVFAGSTAETRSKRNEVIRWRGKESIPYFSGKCSEIYGTNGELFPPSSSSPAPKIDVFVPMLCRPWSLHFNATKQENGLKLASYGTGWDMFSARDEDEIRECAQPAVWPRGLFDVQACQHGFPGLISLPHFLHADENLLLDVDGLTPEVSKHDLHLDIFPLLGVPLAGAVRVQFNVRVHRHFGSVRSANPAVVVPVLWQEVGLSGAAAENLSSVVWYLIRLPEILLQVVPLTMLGLSLCLAIAYAIHKKAILLSDAELHEESQSILESEEERATNVQPEPYA